MPRCRNISSFGWASWSKRHGCNRRGPITTLGRIKPIGPLASHLRCYRQHLWTIGYITLGRTSSIGFSPRKVSSAAGASWHATLYACDVKLAYILGRNLGSLRLVLDVGSITNNPLAACDSSDLGHEFPQTGQPTQLALRYEVASCRTF